MRRHYLDNLRWVTVSSVVVYHALFMYTSAAKGLTLPPFSEVQYQDAVQYLLYPWFMILLFIVAGMCSRYYLEKHTVKEFVRSRTRKLLVPSTIGILLFGWIQGWISMSMQGEKAVMPESVPAPVRYLIMCVSGTSVLWFIQLLWLYSMMLALIRKLEKGRLYSLASRGGIIAAVLLGVPAYFSGQVLNTPVVSVYRIGIYGFVFFLGYFFFASDAVIDRIARFNIPLLVLAAALGALYVYLHFGDNYAEMPVAGCVPAFSYAWAMCLALLGSFRKWFDGTGRFASYMSSRSFGLYVFHYLTMSAAALALYKYARLGALPSYLIVTAAGFIGGIALYELVRRIPFLRWCLLGIKKVKENVQG